RVALAVLAQRLDQLHAGHLRQAQVDDGEIERHLAAEVERLFAVLRRVDGEAVALQSCRQRLAQRGLVFHQEDAHQCFSLPPGRRAGGLRVDGEVGRILSPPLAGIVITRTWPCGVSTLTRYSVRRSRRTESADSTWPLVSCCARLTASPRLRSLGLACAHAAGLAPSVSVSASGANSGRIRWAFIAMLRPRSVSGRSVWASRAE